MNRCFSDTISHIHTSAFVSIAIEDIWFEAIKRVYPGTPTRSRQAFGDFSFVDDYSPRKNSISKQRRNESELRENCREKSISSTVSFVENSFRVRVYVGNDVEQITVNRRICIKKIVRLTLMYGEGGRNYFRNGHPKVNALRCRVLTS